MKGMGGGLQNLMRQANQMQLKMKKLQEELATREYNGTAGGDAVTVKVKGDMKLSNVTIKEDVMKSGDVEMLQDLIVAATNDALTLAKTETDAEMGKVTGGMNIPGMF